MMNNQGNSEKIGKIILAVIGLIALSVALGIIVPNCTVMIQKEKFSRTAADMRVIGTALGSYFVDYDHYPVSPPDVVFTLDNLGYYWREATINDDGATKDAWGHELLYHSKDGITYTLTSYGKDGKEGGSGHWELDIIYINGRFVAPYRLYGGP
jgi:general secretion pathway protein G